MSLYRNILHLFVWQGSTYLVPLIVTPYLARTLGVAGFGAFGLTLSITTFAMLAAGWGFDVTAAQQAARASDDPDRLRILFWNTLVARIGLGIATLCTLALATVATPLLRAIWPAILGGSLIVVSTVLSANWLLQGLQAMRAFAISSLIGKLAVIPLLLLLVHGPHDVPIAIAVQNGTQIVSAIVSLVVARRLVPLGAPIVDPAGAWNEIRRGFHYFISTVSVSVYAQLGAAIVGLTAGIGQAGLLAGSQRIMQAFQQLVVPINMAVFPRINKLTVTDPAAAVRTMFRLLGAEAAFAAGLSIAMAVIAPWAVVAFLGPHFVDAVPVVHVLSAIPLLAGLSNVLGGNMQLPLGLNRSYLLALLVAGAFNLAALAMLAPRYGALGGAWATVTTETLLVLLQAASLVRARAVFARMRAGQSPVASL
jgi:O-antigen/teichoic acid export membrane protein